MTSFKEFSDTYNSNLNEFLSDCPDASELDYINDILKKYEWIVFEFENKDILIEGGQKVSLDSIFNKNRYYSADKIIDFLNEKKQKFNIQDVNDDKIIPRVGLSIPEIALLNAFIHLFEDGKKMFKGNAKEFLKGTTYVSTNKLIDCFNNYLDEKNRMNFVSNSGRADTKLLNEQKARYLNILPLLENKYPIAFAKASEELEKLNKK
jgi:hypothetical protein